MSHLFKEIITSAPKRLLMMTIEKYRHCGAILLSVIAMSKATWQSQIASHLFEEITTSDIRPPRNDVGKITTSDIRPPHNDIEEILICLLSGTETLEILNNRRCHRLCFFADSGRL